MKQSYERGLTLLELLVIISIIGLLVSVVLYATADARFQSKATAMAAQMKQIERGLYSYRFQEKLNGWPAMPSNNYAHENNQLNTLVNSATFFPNLNKYIPAEPVNYASSPYTYFNRGGSYVECVVSGDVVTEVGASIRIENIDDRLFEYIDAIIDGEYDPDCGKLKRVGGSESAYYDISSL